MKTAADEGMIFVNGIKAKPALEIKPDDIVELDTPRFYRKVRVLTIPPKNLKKSDASTMYDLLEERKKELI